MTRRTLALAVVTLVAGLWFAGVRAPGPVGEARSPSAAMEGAAKVTVRAPGGARSVPTDTREARARPEPGESAPAPTSTQVSPLEGYLAASVYPPTSRPIAEGDRSLVDFAARHERPRPVEGAREFELLFTADRAWLVGDGTRLLVVLAAWSGRAATAPAGVRVTLSANGASAREVALGADTTLPTTTRLEVEALLARHQRTGPVLAAIVTPAELGLTTPTTLRLDAEVTLGGRTVQRHLLVPYTPEAAVPARFTGRFEESIEDGSLVVHAGLEVREPGWYLIDINLHEVEGRPLAWTRFKGELGVGSTSVPLRFFGKVLRDLGARAPFEIGQLRGARYRPGTDPNLAQIPPFDGHFRTKSYPLELFADAAWDSPQKQARIAKLRDLESNPDAPSLSSPVAR
ncbi:MAG: hypothetical protein FJ096_14700 [Deltaproteobacteria bacterium]|nr:hypothetical protein [Deltaproteobacteria bacterium]